MLSEDEREQRRPAQDPVNQATVFEPPAPQVEIVRHQHHLGEHPRIDEGHTVAAIVDLVLGQNDRFVEGEERQDLTPPPTSIVVPVMRRAYGVAT